MDNNSNRVVKVCKVDSLTFASFAIKQDVDFLGVHILDNSDLGKHKELSDYINENSGKLVIVTKITSIIDIDTIIKTYRPFGIQLHYEIDIDLISKIKATHPKVLIFAVFTNQNKYLDFEKIDEACDFLIYDTSFVGGTNRTTEYLHYNDFPNTLKLKTLLAGKISLERIRQLQALNSRGYDIQSYFRFGGEINYKNLESVCDQLKFPRINKLSISLTDLPLNKIYKISTFYLNNNIEYHLDYSDESLYKGFQTKEKSIEEKAKFLSQLPFSVHLFMNQEDEVIEKAIKLIERHPLNLIRIFIQYYPGMNIERIYQSLSGIKIVQSIYYKDITNFMSLKMQLQFLSIIVPDPSNNSNFESFIYDFKSHSHYFIGKEIWLDRDLNATYIKMLMDILGHYHFNFVIGKEAIKNWDELKIAYEYLPK